VKLLSSFWQRWKKLALKLAKFQTLILLALFYFTLFALYALIPKLIGRDLLDKKWKRDKSFWVNKPRLKVDFESAKRQF
jgi:hypothetical protein